MTVRMSGIGGSGMDTEAMIKVMVDARKLQVDQLEEKNDKQTDLFTSWTKMDVSLSTLNSKSAALTNYSAWKQMSATSTNDGAMTATATSQAAPGVYNTNVTQLATSHRIASDTQVSKDTDLGLTGAFTIGGEEITVAAGATLEDIRDSVNTASLNMADADKVKATIIGTTLVLEKSETGATGITIGEDDDGILQNLGVLASATVDDYKNEKTTAKDLIATINGVEVTGTKNTGLDDLVDGMSFSFYEETTTSLTVAHDKETIKGLLEDFVEQYNETMKLVKDYSAVNLSGTGDLDTIGKLQGDSLMGYMQQKSRENVLAVDDGNLDPDFNSLLDIGIWSTSQENQISIVDEGKLDAALTNNFESVRDLIRDFDHGIIKKFESFVDDMVSPIDGRITNKKNYLQKAVDDRALDIQDMMLRIEEYETSLWLQFSNMENTVNSIQSQGSMMMSMMGMSSG